MVKKSDALVSIVLMIMNENRLFQNLMTPCSIIDSRNRCDRKTEKPNAGTLIDRSREGLEYSSEYLSILFFQDYFI